MCVCVCVRGVLRYFYHFSTPNTAGRSRGREREREAEQRASLCLSNGLQRQRRKLRLRLRLLRLLRLLLIAVSWSCMRIVVFAVLLCFVLLPAHMPEPLSHSHTLSFVLFDVVVVNCSSLLSCTLHNAPLITAEWEKERERAQLLLVFVNGFLFVYMRV